MLTNAESTHSGTRHITDCIDELNVHARRVAEHFWPRSCGSPIAPIFLALNAALEGTKAGRSRQGDFTLVAAEMRRLAENVIESVSGIRQLMKDVRAASQKAVRASHDGTQLSEQTTLSAREDRALVTQDQRRATEQVRTSMDEMTALLNHTMRSIKQMTREAGELAGLAIGDDGPRASSSRHSQGGGRAVIEVRAGAEAAVSPPRGTAERRRLEMFRALGSRALNAPQPGLDSSSEQGDAEPGLAAGSCASCTAQRRGRAAGLFRAGRHLPSAGRAPARRLSAGAVTRRPAIASFWALISSRPRWSARSQRRRCRRATRLFGGRWDQRRTDPVASVATGPPTGSADGVRQRVRPSQRPPLASWKRRAIAPATAAAGDQPARHRGSARSHA